MARIPTQPTTESGLPALVPHGRFKGKPVMHLGRPVTVIGARNRSHLHLVSPSVSKSHAMVVNTGAGFYVRDLASRTHIYVNGQQVKEAELKDGDILAVGPFTFRFTDPGRSSGKRGAAPVPAVLRTSDRALPVSLDSRVTMIGRRPTCEIAIDESDVSTTHAVVFEMNGKRFIRDLGSRTGTFVNGTAIHQQPLEFGDTIRIGTVEMSYVDAADELAIGSEPDETDDLAGTAKLPAQDLAEPMFERPAARSAAAVAPRGVDIIANDNGHIPVDSEGVAGDELDLSLEPVAGIGGDGQGLTPPAAPQSRFAEVPEVPASPEAVDDWADLPLEPAGTTEPAPAVEGSVSEDSSIGIELLPQDPADIPTRPTGTEAEGATSGLDLAAEPTADHAPTPAPAEADFGLDFAEPATPAARAEAAGDLELVDLDALEVMEKTEPTPESAIALDDVLPPDDSVAGKVQPAAPAADAMTDSVFGREVAAFEGPGLGPLVESRPLDEVAHPPVVSEAPPEKSADADPLIYEEPAPAAEAPPVREAAAEVSEPAADAAATKRRGGRKPAVPKAAKKPGAPKRKPPSRQSKAAEAAAAAAAEATPVEESAPGESALDVTPEPDLTTDVPIAAADDAPAPEVVAEVVPEITAEPAPLAADAVPAGLVEEDVEPPPPVVAERAEPAIAAEPSVLDAPAAAAEPPPITPLDAPEPAAEEPVAAPAEEAEPFDLDLDLPAVDASAAEPTPGELGTAEPSPLDLNEPVALELDLQGAPAAAGPAEQDEPLGMSAVTDEAEAPADAAVADVSEPPAGSAQEPVAEAEAPPAPAKPDDLFFGLERDTASFLGGMPLQLPPLQSPFAPQARVDFTSPPAAANLRPPSGESAEPDELDEPELLSLDGDDDLPLDADAPDGEAEAPVDLGIDDDDDDDVAPAAPAAGGTAPAAPASPFRPAPPPPARSAGAAGRERPARPGQPGAPAPQRRAGASSPFDLNFEDVPTDRIEIPPFTGPGPATRGHVTTAFDGLAMPPVREADVFSQRPVDDTIIPPFASPGGGPGGAKGGAADNAAADVDEFGGEDEEPIDLSAADDELAEAPRRGGDGADAGPPADDDAVDAGEARKSWQPLSPARRPPAYPAEPAGGRPAPKKKKRWRIGKWGLFGLMLVTMGVASLAIWYGWPAPTATVTGRIEFTKLDAIPEAERQRVLAAQRVRIGQKELRASAREILASNYGGLGPGFLAESGTPGEVTETAETFRRITDSLELVDKKPVILVKHNATDGEGDQKRMLALLHALYAENKPLIDADGELARALDKKQAELMQAQIEYRAMQPAMDDARQQLGGDRNAVVEKQALVDALQQKERQLSAAWNKTTARVKQLTADALAAESAMPFDLDADPAEVPPAAEEDPQAVEMARRAEELAARLAAAKQRRAGQAEEARKAMATALKKFEDDIARARAEMKPDTELGRYLEAAEGVQRQIKIVSGDLAQQQRSDMERLAMLKQKLAEKNEARIRRAFAGDPDLQAMQEQLALKERQFNTAARGGLRDDAKALEKEVKALRVEIESRQDLLTTADGVAPDMKELETFIGETLARMEKDRARNDRIMAEHLKQLAAKAPAAASLPAEQKAFAEQLGRRQAELNKAREGYAAAVEAAAAEADADVKDVEAELAAVQAKLDERKKQVAEAARKSLTADQQRERVTITQKSRRNLDTAQKADEEAAAAYLANRRALADAEEQLERLKRRNESFDRGNAKAVVAQRRMGALSEEVEQLRKQADASVVPVKPTDDHVALAPQAPDRRLTYVLATCLVLGLVYGALVAAAPLHPRQADDAEDGAPFNGHRYGDGDDGHDGVPFAAPAASDPDEPALAAALAMEHATDDEHHRRPGESPVPA